MEMNNAQNIFVTFGAGRSGWIGAAKRITAEAQRTGLFEFSFNLDERWLKAWDPEIYEIGLNLRKTLPARGFGYWTWKPSVLLWADLFFPSHQVVYVDAGSQFARHNLEGSELDSDLRLSFANKGLAWTLEGHPENAWTKQDLISHLELSSDMVDSAQIQSGFIALSPLWDRKAILLEWRELARAQSGIFFTDVSIKANPEIFIEHRHDQSALSCLWKLHGLPINNDKTHPTQTNEYPILAWRNNSALRTEAFLIFRKILKLYMLTKDLILRNR